MDNVAKIASLITEDPDVFSTYEKAFEENTVLDETIYGDIVRILKSVAQENGLALDHRKLKVKFNPAGLTLRNIHLEVIDPSVKRELIDRVAQATGDDNIRHTFNQNLRVNLYTAINKEFANRIREELNLDVTHQTVDPEGLDNTSEILPMASFVQPAATASPPEEELDMGEPMSPEPAGGPQATTPPPDMPAPGGGGVGGLGGLSGGLEEPPSEPADLEEPAPEEEPVVGPFGMEPPEEEPGAEPEEELPPAEEEDLPRLEGNMDYVDKIASLLTEDPDIIEKNPTQPKIKKSKPKPKSKKTLTESAEAEERNHLIQYMREGNTFRPIGDIELHKTLPSALYVANTDHQGPNLKVFKPVTDDLIFFEDSKMDSVLKEVSKFWELKENFNKLGYLHNRGILLYGPPGTGKTCLMHQITESMINAGDVVFQASHVYDIKTVLGAFRKVEPSRRVVIVLEDMDEYIGHQEREMLQLLDGSNAVDNVLFLGSTNYIDRFPPRLLRPGRFDKKVYIDYPPMNGRLAYLENKLDGIEEQNTIQELAEKTDGFSFGHLRELVIAGYAFQEDLGQTIARLRGLEVSSLPIRESEEIKLNRRTLTD